MTILDYLNLVTSAFRQKPKFTAMITSVLDPIVRVQELVSSLPLAYDVETAVGAQLDVVGEWVGVTRNVITPIPGVYFSWDADAALGWDYGIWQGNQTVGAITELPDDAYRLLIRAKIAANRWDGTTEGAYNVWEAVFPTLTIVIKDNQDMTYELGFVGGTLDSLTLALVTQGYIPLKPEGVQLVGIFTPANAGPLFAWDTESDFLAGWDEGSWVNQYPV